MKYLVQANYYSRNGVACSFRQSYVSQLTKHQLVDNLHQVTETPVSSSLYPRPQKQVVCFVCCYSQIMCLLSSPLYITTYCDRIDYDAVYCALPCCKLRTTSGEQQT